jgi:anti-sigma28 factor (negative regulator of flagellin synthesis)
MDHCDNPSTGKRRAADPTEPVASSGPDRDTFEHDPIDNERLEKITKLKKAVADGTYNVPAEEVARKLIEDMLEPKS